jgi:hypothetical protein
MELSAFRDAKVETILLISKNCLLFIKVYFDCGCTLMLLPYKFVEDNEDKTKHGCQQNTSCAQVALFIQKIVKRNQVADHREGNQLGSLLHQVGIVKLDKHTNISPERKIPVLQKIKHHNSKTGKSDAYNQAQKRRIRPTLFGLVFL